MNNYTNITLSQVFEGSQYFDPTFLMAMVILCFGIAFGAQWGFNKIYSPRRIEKFKNYRSELVLNLKFKLKSLALTTYKDDGEFNRRINEFIAEWQDFEDNIKEYYNKLLWWRKEILIIFSLAGISYFFRLIRPDLVWLSYRITTISNFLFILGLISMLIFCYKIIKLDSQIAKYIIEKPNAEETISKIAKKVFRKNKTKVV